MIAWTFLATSVTAFALSIKWGSKAKNAPMAVLWMFAAGLNLLGVLVNLSEVAR